jgi:hypothetical protein
MKKISEAEFVAYLLKAKQKLETPVAHVAPETQVVVAGDAGGKGVKRGRRGDAASTSNKAAKLGSDLEDDGEPQGQRIPVLVKGERTTCSRAAAVVTPEEPLGPNPLDGESSKPDTPPTWNEDFDPITFVSENLKGYSSCLDTLGFEDLRKLAVGTGLKCLALNQMVFNRQEKEASDRLEKAVGAAKEEPEKDLAGQLAKSQADFHKGLDKKKKKVSALRKNKRSLMTARNAMIVALVKIWKDAEQRDKDIVQLREAADRLDGDIKDLEEENGALKVAMAEQFVEGFQAALEQIRVLFPDIVGDRMAQVDFMKKVEDGKLVSRLP